MNPDGSGKCRLAENMRLVDNGVFAVQAAEPERFDGPPLNFPHCENAPAFVDAGWRFAVEPVFIGVALNATTGERIQLSDRTLGDALYGSRVSPDQQMVALVLSDASYDRTLYLTGLSNPQPQLVTLSDEPTTSLSWSPDSQLLLIVTQNEATGGTSLVRINVASGEQTILYENKEFGYAISPPAWSTSGDRFAFASGNEFGESHLILMNADDSAMQVIDTPVWYGELLWRPE